MYKIFIINIYNKYKMSKEQSIELRTKKPAPNNAQLDFSTLTQTVKASVDGTNLPDLPPVPNTVAMPDNFKWDSTKTDYGNPTLQNKANLITPVQNQQACGCCWAYSFATSLSDNYVVQGVLDYNPDISTTYLLTQTRKAGSGLSTSAEQIWTTTLGDGCDGGNPAKLAEFIKNFGAASNNCVDYSWCDSAQGCGLPGVAPGGDLNSILPNNGCFIDNANRKGYKLDRAWQQTISDYKKAEVNGTIVNRDDTEAQKIFDSNKLRAFF